MAHEREPGAALKIVSVLAALGVWELAVRLVDNRLLLVGPVETLECLWKLIREPAFWRAALASSGRIMAGFALALLAALLLAAFAARFRVFEALLRPYIVTIRTVPVASFIVIALLWLSGNRLSTFISFLMVLPPMYENVLAGLRSADAELSEMARVFRMPPVNRLRCIYIPAMEPYLLSAANTALGMCWKAGVAAEVIGVAASSIGGHIYEAKVTLDIPALFAWTAVTVALSVGLGKLTMILLRKTLKAAEGV